MVGHTVLASSEQLAALTASAYVHLQSLFFSPLILHKYSTCTALLMTVKEDDIVRSEA